jgi:hypothetical protein
VLKVLSQSVNQKLIILYYIIYCIVLLPLDRIFLENQTAPLISMKNRFDAFRKNYRNDIKFVQSIDYNQALQKELEGKNN